MTATLAQARAALNIVLALAEAIRELGRVPSGTLYANVMGKLDLATYEAAIRMLKNAGLVKETAHELEWTGPAKGERG